MPLFSPQPLVLETAYSELKRQALEQTFVWVGTPGSVDLRKVGGATFLYRQFYDPSGKKKAEYIGPAGDEGTKGRATAIREGIALTNGLLTQARFLARHGYVRVDARSGAVLAALANHGLFRAGALVVGSHAYGVLLNELGVRSAGYRTEDIDIARNETLTLDTEHEGFERMLADSTLPLSPVLGLDRKAPPTSYKTPGRDSLRVDLLVPASGREIAVRPVPELRAHATALPHLRYLLDDPLEGILLGREAVVPVKVPRPERFVFHKMLVSQMRNETSEKRGKDLHQAAVLFAVLAEREPAALEEAFERVEAPRKTRAGAERVLDLLEGGGHSRAVEVLRELLG